MKTITHGVVGTSLIAAVVAVGGAAQAGSYAYDSGYGTSGYGTSGYGTSGYGTSGYGTSGYGTSGYGTSGYGTSGYGIAAGGCYGTTGYGTAARYADPVSTFRAPFATPASYDRWNDRSYTNRSYADHSYAGRSYTDRWDRTAAADRWTASNPSSYRDRYDDCGVRNDGRYDSRYDSVRDDRYAAPKLGSAWPGTSLPSAIRRW